MTVLFAVVGSSAAFAMEGVPVEVVNERVFTVTVNGAYKCSDPRIAQKRERMIQAFAQKHPIKRVILSGCSESSPYEGGWMMSAPVQLSPAAEKVTIHY